MAKLPTGIEILPPSDDRIFKTLLTHPDAKPVLINVVSAVIERTVIDVQIRNVEPPVMDVDEKAERFDVNCVIDSGDQVDVEMHSSRIEEITGGHRSFLNKSIYYLTDLHSSQKSKGVKYYDFVRTYQVTFCEYTIFPQWPDFVSHFSMRRPNGEQVSDQINMVIIEMSKLGGILKKPVEELTSLEMWTLFFNFASDLKYRDIINKIIDVKEEIGMASALLMEISKDEQERARFRSRRMAETDRISNLLTAEARGKAQGVSEVALSMKREGMPIETIARLTNLSVQEIEKLS
jgi:predicted transposase/invertase (TIGR01784 family)